jgi:S1-C subfamily serine protease
MKMQDYSGYGQPPSGPGGFGGPTSPMPPVPPRPPRRRIGLLSYAGVALAAGALGAGTVVALYHPTANSSAAPGPSSSALAPPPAANSPAPLPTYAPPGTSASASAILKKVAPGLVIINTTLQYSAEQAAGTGMVISAGGRILTNNHVIENATKISATVLATGRTYPVKVVGYDVTGDIALLQMQGASGLHTVPIGNSASVKTGDAVVAMGNAQGQSEIVPAAGQVTGVNQTITANDQGGTITSETLHGMIETNADVVSGDSGGPLANSAGRVIGMDTAGDDVGYSQQQTATGFAIPINTALAVAGQIAAGQASSAVTIGYPPFIGIYIAKASSSSPQAQAEQEQQNTNGGFGNIPGFGNPGNGSGTGSSGTGSSGTGGGNASCYTSDANLAVPSSIASVSSGTLVIGTICGSPAASAGLTAGSVITAVNGQAVGSPASLTGIVSKYRPGTTISVAWVTPSGQHETGSLALTAGPPL